jgi:hypothetical protein
MSTLSFDLMTEDESVPVVTLPEDAADPKFDLMRGVKELEQERPKYTKAQLYYSGEVSEWHANPRVAHILANSSVGYPFRLAAVPVDALTDRVRLTRVLVDKGAQGEFDDAWEANDMQAWSTHQLHRTFLYGDAYMRVWPAGEDDEDRIADAGVRYTYLSPFGTRVVYSERDGKTPLFAIQRWVEDSRVRADITYPDRIVRWITAKSGDTGHNPASWVAHNVDGEPHEEPLPESVAGELPIKHSRIGLVYGRPAHENAYAPQNAIMKHLVTQLATVDTQGWPVRMLLTDPSAVLDQVTDGPDWDDDEGSNAENGITDGEQSNVVPHQIREAPGVMQVLQGIKQVATFNATDPKHLIEPVLKMYLPIMASTTRTPYGEFEVTASDDRASGRARGMRDGPFRAKTERYKDLLTDFWEQVAALTLRILEKPESETVEIGWVSHGIVSDKESWEAAHLMLTAGVPFDVVMTQHVGFDPATVRNWTPPLLGPTDGPADNNPGPRSGGVTGVNGNPTAQARSDNHSETE